jgi:hypothetical protein
MTNVRPSQLLDRELWSALDLPVARTAEAAGDATVTEEDVARRLPLIT